MTASSNWWEYRLQMIVSQVDFHTLPLLCYISYFYFQIRVYGFIVMHSEISPLVDLDFPHLRRCIQCSGIPRDMDYQTNGYFPLVFPSCCCLNTSTQQLRLFSNSESVLKRKCVVVKLAFMSQLRVGCTHFPRIHNIKTHNHQ